MLILVACLALVACGGGNGEPGGEHRAKDAPEAVAAKACDSTPEKGRATREAAVEAYLSAVQRGCVEELAALYTPQNFVPDEGKNGHRSTRDALRDMVNARCGLRLEHREIDWGPKEPYGLDATIEYYDAHFSADVEPAPGRYSRFRDNAHVEHVKTKVGKRWFLRPLMPFAKAEVEAVPKEDRCFPVELMGRLEAVIEAREGVAHKVERLPVSDAFRAVVANEIERRADFGSGGDAEVFVTAQPIVVRLDRKKRIFVKAQVLTEADWGASNVWFEASFVKDGEGWVIDSLSEEGDGNRRIEWTEDET